MRRSAVMLPLAALLFGGAARVLSAQGTGGLVVDRVVAVVGKTPILDSKVDEMIYRKQGEGLKIPTDSAALIALKRQFIDSLITEELLFQQAQADTMVKVTEQETNDATDQVVRNVRKALPSELDFNTELRREGWQSVEEWRRYLLEEQHRALMISRFRQRLEDQGKLKPLSPTEKEMREFYDRMKGSFDSLPPTISIKQIVIAPKANDAAKATARALADSLARELRKGDSAAFANAAKRFSMDSVSGALGGELGWARRGKYVPEFERVVFALKPGVISDPVETPFGFHVIQVSRVNAGEVNARHILIMPTIDSAAAATAKALAESVYAALMRGANFDSLQYLYHNPAEEKVIEDVPLPSLEASAPEYGRALAGVDTGQIAKPFRLGGAKPSFADKWAIVRVTARHPAGPVSFESLSERIRVYLGKENATRSYINSLRAKTYIEIKYP
jgi:peptidyl-prolyl cis-trans isomerase SurA